MRLKQNDEIVSEVLRHHTDFRGTDILSGVKLLPVSSGDVITLKKAGGYMRSSRFPLLTTSPTGHCLVTIHQRHLTEVWPTGST